MRINELFGKLKYNIYIQISYLIKYIFLIDKVLLTDNKVKFLFSNLKIHRFLYLLFWNATVFFNTLASTVGFHNRQIILYLLSVNQDLPRGLCPFWFLSYTCLRPRSIFVLWRYGMSNRFIKTNISLVNKNWQSYRFYLKPCLSCETELSGHLIRDWLFTFYSYNMLCIKISLRSWHQLRIEYRHSLKFKLNIFNKYKVINDIFIWCIQDTCISCNIIFQSFITTMAPSFIVINNKKKNGVEQEQYPTPVFSTN